jgi:hypothetical protein
MTAVPMMATHLGNRNRPTPIQEVTGRQLLTPQRMCITSIIVSAASWNATRKKKKKKKQRLPAQPSRIPFLNLYLPSRTLLGQQQGINNPIPLFLRPPPSVSAPYPPKHLPGTMSLINLNGPTKIRVMQAPDLDLHSMSTYLTFCFSHDLPSSCNHVFLFILYTLAVSPPITC